MDRKLISDADVTTVLYSKDGTRLYSLCGDSKVRVWNTSTGTVSQTIAYEPGDVGATLMPSGLMTHGKDGSTKIWDLAKGSVAKRVPPSAFPARRMTMAADGGFFQANSATDTRLRLIDAQGRERFAVPAGAGGLGALAVSPDGRIVVAGSYDADMRAWNSQNGELLRLIDELPVSMFDLEFSPDGKMLAAAGADKTVYFYDTRTWRQLRKWTGLPEMVSALAFSADGVKLLTGGFNEITLKHPVKVIVWDVGTGKPQRTVDAAQRVTSVAFAPDGKSFAVSTGRKSIDLWGV